MQLRQQDSAYPPSFRVRRLFDEILLAFHQAADQADFEVADKLLTVLETALRSRSDMPPTTRRRSVEGLVAAHERLWHLRNRGDYWVEQLGVGARATNETRPAMLAPGLAPQTYRKSLCRVPDEEGELTARHNAPCR